MMAFCETLNVFSFFTLVGSEGVGGITQTGESRKGVGVVVQTPARILSLLLHYYY
jgi:superfamily II DNA/RNA helicase